MRVEDHIRNAIDRAIEDAFAEVPDNMPRRVRSRVRGRQALSVAVVGVVAAALTLGGIGLSRILIDEPRRPVTQPTIEPPEESAVLASGVFRRVAWQLEVTHDDSDGWCLVVTRGPGTSRFCSFTGEKALEIRRGVGFVFGTVSKRVEYVRASEQSFGRLVDIRILEIPEALDAPFDIVFAIPHSGGNVSMGAFDRHGERLQRGFV
jgi:hypothetical protein